MSESFYSAFLTIHRSGVLTALAWLVPRETAAISARSVLNCSCKKRSLPRPHCFVVFANTPVAKKDTFLIFLISIFSRYFLSFFKFLFLKDDEPFDLIK